MKKILCLLLALLGSGAAFAEDARDRSRLYYLYEVANQLPLSDFELGSGEVIRDRDGNGFGLALVIKRGDKISLALDMGNSATQYLGSVEDGVEVGFEPQSGSGYEALSSSTNVTYNFDMKFQNPYLGATIYFDHFLIGGGRLFQSAQGNVTLSSQGVELVEATYVPGNQMYWQAGFTADLDWLYISILARGFEAPELKILSCNAAAIGDLACARIEGATGNRNQRSTNFGEGVLRVGFLF
ncbi:MAG: hypothetical protein RRB13_11345 [bacterium]|nr:hypothetical protein [bacterium]